MLSHFPSIQEYAATELGEVQRIFGNVEHLVKYYVAPDAQNVNPADSSEDDTGLVSRTSALAMLDRFLPGDPSHSHTFVLSDAGMGKTSLLLMLRLANINKLVRSPFDVRLLKLGAATLGAIDSIRDPASTILLLDALDEDPEAWTSFYARLQALLQATKNFRKTVITCRTQFFPSQHEQDGHKPGVVSLHGFRCSKLFLSPFSDEQVDQYIRQRFAEEDRQRKALEIARQMKSLKFRPMLLSYIELLLPASGKTTTRTYSTALDVYEALIAEWFSREVQKGIVPEEKPLQEACMAIATYLYDRKETNDRTIDRAVIGDLCSKIDALKFFDDMAVEGRSLLHRTSENTYKFAHYSVLEYLIATGLIAQPRSIRNTDQVKAFLVDAMRTRGHKRLREIDLSSSVIVDVMAKSIDASGAAFTSAKIKDCDFSHGNFMASQMGNAVIESVNFNRANMSGAKLTKARITKCSFAGADVQGADFSEALMTECVASSAVLANVAASKIVIQNSQIEECGVRDCVLDGCVVESCTARGGSLTAGVVGNVKIRDVLFSEYKINVGLVDLGELASVRVVRSELERPAFKNCEVRDGVLEESNCEGLSIGDSRVAGCQCVRSTLRGARISGTLLNQARVDGGVFANGVFERCQFIGLTVDGTQVQSVKLGGCQINELRATGGEWIDIDATDADIKGARLSRMRLRGVSLRGARLVGSVFSDTTFERVDLTGADCSGIEAAGLDFRECRLASCRLVGASLQNCVLHGLAGMQMATSKLIGSTFVGGSFAKSDFEGADLTGLVAELCDLRDAKMTRAVLKGARMRGANLTGAVLVAADLRGADLTDAKLDGAVLRGAIVNAETRLPGLTPTQSGELVRETGKGN